MSNILRRFRKAALHFSSVKTYAVAGKTFESSTVMASQKSGEALKKLREFGYAFNKEGQLRKVDQESGEPGDEPFQFDVFNDQAKNQAHYEKLADQIPEIVYDLLEQQGLTRTYIPENLPQEESTFIFTKPEKLNKSKKLIVIIHGSGYVRAGQWARSLIINNSLDHGTQIPYIKKAISLGYDVLVTNTNDNYRIINGIRKPIPESSSATAHAAYVWEKYVMGSQPESVAIVAHSYGGSITFDLAKRFPEFFKDNVFAIALTDSAHFGVQSSILKIIADKTCNWVSSNEPLDTEMRMPKGEIASVSAGHQKHEWSSYSAFESVFKFLEKKYDEFVEQKGIKSAKLDA